MRCYENGARCPRGCRGRACSTPAAEGRRSGTWPRSRASGPSKLGPYIRRSVRALLLYGPDEGRAREYARALVAGVAGQPPDPFRYAELSAAQIKEHPAALADEAGQLSFTGGRRVVRVRAGAAEAAAACEILL